ncbi:ADP-ribosylglycohydrolase [Psychromicrobium silvestre]|uniref:ADP-ribosylglycohydrolase n=1 Tax=Psychromicrobium silvestre TaxID=1645614 RepID=A0A7Y9LUQ4_9MICC|nr:ADP-ribosylglycohydrolase family protein [Psychromicrobium silvestre]NYE95968.1 ADP-ribosylglycohydrolase [Psychromicrobium silvestre]
MSATDRALGSLYGLAIGDALGMPTQMMSREVIAQQFAPFNRFFPAAADHPLAAGMPAGSITDDTEQALLLAQLLLDGGGRVDEQELARRLVAWEQQMRQRGSLDLLGPSTKRAVEAVLAGESVEQSGRYGVTNGAAMRIAPVGIMMSATSLPSLVDRVVEASRVSHNTGVAIAAASAVAAAVSAGIDGASVSEAIDLGLRAAELGANRGHWVAAASVPARIRLALDLANSSGSASQAIYELIGTSLASQESIPAAFGILALHRDEPWQACLTAASLGGDSDTIAAIVGAITGAVHGMAGWPAEAVSLVKTVNSMELDGFAASLLALRQ